MRSDHAPGSGNLGVGPFHDRRVLAAETPAIGRARGHDARLADFSA
jgi:hypothetical protein